MQFALNKLAQDGIIPTPRQLLLDTASELLKVDNPARVAALDAQAAAEELISEMIKTPDGPSAQAICYLFTTTPRSGQPEHVRKIARRASMTSVWKRTEWTKFLKESEAEQCGTD
ncbi:MAG: hypothetical protein R3E39_25790 [Anaerolineae bacterium]